MYKNTLTYKEEIYRKSCQEMDAQDSGEIKENLLWTWKSRNKDQRQKESGG